MCFKKQYGEKTIHGTQWLFLLNQNNPTAVWLLIYTPCGAENFGGEKTTRHILGG